MMATAGLRARAPSTTRLVTLASECLGVPADEIDVRAPLSRYGLDSLTAVELTAALATELGRELPDSVLLEYPDIESLERFLAAGRGDEAPAESALRQMWADAVLPPEIRPGAPAAPAGAARAVLLTGATGFVGAHLLGALLRETPARVSCLVRPTAGADGRTRLRATLARYGIWEPSWAGRVEVVEGDVGRPLLGLTPEAFDALGREIDTVYHAAALVNWVSPYAALREVNVLGTRELLRLACRYRAKPVQFVSSLAVCYSTRGPRDVDEREDMLPFLDGLHLGYAQSKCVAEALVRQASERGLPVGIYRPALVSGDARSGLSNTDDILAALLKGCIQMGCAPDLDWALDCCPVDYVATAVVRLSGTGGEPLRVFHLANPRPRHWRECVLWMNLFGYPVRLVPYPAWLRQLETDATGPGHALRALRSFFVTRPAGQGGLTLPELYAEDRRSRAGDAQTRAALERHALACPPLDARLLDRYFSSFIACGFLPPVRRLGTASGDSPAPPLGREFFTAIVRRFYADQTIRVRGATRLGLGSEHSILTELTSWKYGGAAELSRYRLAVASRRAGVPAALDVVVKRKPQDAAVIDVGESVARLCGDAVGRAYARFRDRLGLTGCHVRELAVYAQTDARFRRHAPTVYGSVRDDDRRTWILVLEDLSGVALMDTADDVSGWRAAEVEAAVDGLVELQAIWYGREATLLRQPWLGPVFSAEGMAEMTELWEALAQHAAPYFGEWLGPGVRGVQRALVSGVGRWWRALEAMPRTLIHNDFNPRNLAMRRREKGLRVCAYDWELATLGVPQHDLAELLCFVLTPAATRAELLGHVERHRVGLERATGRAIHPAEWRLGLRLSLDDLLVNRFAMYVLVHRVRRQRFLERIIRTWGRLGELLGDVSTSPTGATRVAP